MKGDGPAPRSALPLPLGQGEQNGTKREPGRTKP